MTKYSEFVEEYLRKNISTSYNVVVYKYEDVVIELKMVVHVSLFEWITFHFHAPSFFTLPSMSM